MPYAVNGLKTRYFEIDEENKISELKPRFKITQIIPIQPGP